MTASTSSITNGDSTGGRPTSTPNPDPTLLTTEALLREVRALKELIEQRIGGVNDVTNQKFETAWQQFELVERQRVEQKKDTKDAVDAALTAQKEAVKEQTTASERAIAKSETATNKQLEQQSLTSATANEALRRAIDEVKERIGDVSVDLRSAISEVDRKTSGLRSEKDGGADYRVALFGIIATISALASILAVVFSAMK